MIRLLFVILVFTGMVFAEPPQKGEPVDKTATKVAEPKTTKPATTPKVAEPVAPSKVPPATKSRIIPTKRPAPKTTAKRLAPKPTPVIPSKVVTPVKTIKKVVPPPARPSPVRSSPSVKTTAENKKTQSTTGTGIKGVPILVISDSINPGTADYLITAIEEADMKKVPYLVLQLDTPGGLLNATRTIVKKMLNAKTPIVVFIGPKGAHAGSAGAIITFAADVAAMAPGTNIGAAHPVVPGSEKIDETMRKKMANDTAAFAESLAKAKGRNTEWAVKAVKESASIIAEDALKKGVIDLMADDLQELLEILPGYALKVPKAGATKLSKERVSIRMVEMSIKQKIVSFFSDPNLAYMIMSLGGLCIWVELTHPGLIFPGVLGVVCIILSLISFQMLPISYGALAFIFLGLAMMAAEVFLPTYGLLGLGGVAAFIFGSLFLMDTGVPEFQVSLSIILPTAAVLVSCVVFLGFLVVRSQGTRKRSGLEALVGELGDVRENVSDNSGMVFVQGELWKAASEKGEVISSGTIVTVTGVRGMVLVVDEQN